MANPQQHGQQNPGAGWYEDSDGQGQRWWDGNQWTDRRRSAWGAETGGRYEVEVLRSRAFSGTLPERKLVEILNNRAANGWELVRTVTAQSRLLLLFSRTSVFLIFQRID